MSVKCIYGDVKRIIFENEKRVILIRSSLNARHIIEAEKIRREYKKQGYKVDELDENEETERLLDMYCFKREQYVDKIERNNEYWETKKRIKRVL